LAPTVFNHFTVQQVTRMQPQVMKNMSYSQTSQLNVKAAAGFTAHHMAQISLEALNGLTVDHVAEMQQETLAGLNALNVGGLASDVTFAMGLDILNTMAPAEVEKISTVDMLKIVSNLDAGKVKPKDVEKYFKGRSELKFDIKTGKLKYKKGKMKLPKKLKKLVRAGLVLPDQPDLNVSLRLGGTFAQKTIVTELTQTLVLKYPAFSFKQLDTGFLEVEGNGRKFAFMVASDGIEQLDEGTQPGLTQNKDGHYELITADSMKVTLKPAIPKPELMLEAIPDIKVEFNEHGETQLEIPSDEPGKEPSKMACVFESEVVKAEAGLEVGINLLGTPGVDEVAKIVLDDGSMLVAHPTVVDRGSAESATPGLMGKSLDYQYLTNGTIRFDLDGYRFSGKPEFKVTTVTKREQSVLKVLKPSKLIELITKEGKRQRFHLEIIGEALDSVEVGDDE